MTDGAEVLGGVDLGGTKIEAVVLRGGDVIARRRVPTPRAEGYEAIVDAVAGLARALAAEAGLAAVPPLGVGMPGGVTWRTPTGARSPFPLVKNSNTTCLNGRPFRDDLARALGGATRVVFENDANCFALAEATHGAARGARVAFGVILGTGVGGGVVVADAGGVPRLWPGAQGIAGEWGHVALEPRDGPPCYCGRRGCVETFVSGPALEAAHTAATGEHLALAEIARRAVGDDEPARATLARAAALVGRALAYVVNVLDPDVVVLGGGVSNLPNLPEDVARELARHVFNDALETRIVANALGDDAGVLGAALLAASGARDVLDTSRPRAAT